MRRGTRPTDVMKRSDIARLRLYNQQLVEPLLTTPAEVVRWFGAVQSQDLAASLYAIGLRTRSASESLVERSLTQGCIVRSWPMRRTIHCMAAEDARWMTRMLAPRQIVRMSPYHRKMGITQSDLKRAGKVIQSALEGKFRLTRADMYEQLNAAGIATGDMKGLHILVHWALEGLVCLGPRKGKQPTFVLLDDWSPRDKDFSGDEALSELAKRYFQSHGPATVKDFAWWTGVTMAEARRALWLIDAMLKSAKVEGVEYWLMCDTPDAAPAPPTVCLLPAFDEYTVAYADRSIAANEEILRSVNHGLSANIVVNGQIAGTWKRVLSGKGTVVVVPSLLRKLAKKEQLALAKAAGRYGAFVGGTSVTSGGRTIQTGASLGK